MRVSTRSTRFIRPFALLALALCASAVAAEDKFPSGPVTLIVPYAPGGTTDVVARQYAVALQTALGQSVVVENRPGVSGTLGAQALLRAKPDGYTLAMIPATVFRQPFIQKTAYDPASDFTYLARISGYTFGIVVRADSPWQSWADFLKSARADPGKYSYGSPGQFSTPHVTMLEIGAKTGISLNAVPYKSDAECIPALLGGHVSMCAAGSSAGTLVDSGKLRWLNLWTERRSTRWPDVPTLRELGLDLVSASPYGIAGPKGMKEPVVRVLEDALHKAAVDPVHLAALKRQDQALMYMDGAAYKRFVAEQISVERAMVQRLGLKAD
ncbi:extra-cytoplasmic solute receptor (plasmid) [Cupriavidus metallidurans CH34]|uniref:Extra-cytoplasmic solute receptor n=1 Tax=Cupriavidus metallidurans (strain ATCC 43123 / DSM 2839 / NBRC 102507 / CH34) TaxID=266264 RepID=Q1LGP3_CUPMC|nr:extra-cytoplasmic solute receptor [Cupriavidus metallidurans CH34]